MEIERAIIRLGGNRALYSEVAEKFVDAAKPCGPALRELLLQGEHDAAAEVLHTMKGSAGMVGAAALQHHAARLENDMNATTGLDDAALARLDELIAQTCTALDEFLGARSVTTWPGVGSPSQARALLPELIGLLEQANMRAADVFATFEDAWGTPAPVAMRDASVAMAKLDFKAALHCVQQLPELS